MKISKTRKANEEVLHKSVFKSSNFICLKMHEREPDQIDEIEPYVVNELDGFGYDVDEFIIEESFEVEEIDPHEMELMEELYDVDETQSSELDETQSSETDETPSSEMDENLKLSFEIEEIDPHEMELMEELYDMDESQPSETDEKETEEQL